MRWHVFEPTEDSDDDAAEAVYGKPLRLRPRFSEADVVVAFEADPLGYGPDQVRFGRELVDRRKRDRASFRFYAVECDMTLTGAFADHRLAARPDAIEAMAAALAAALGAPIARPALPREQARFIAAAAKDLRAAVGRGLVRVGPALANARALGVWINDQFNAPVDAFDVDPRQARAGTLAQLTDDLQHGKVETLVILDSNPVAAARAISNSKRGSIARPSGPISGSTMTRPRRLRPGACRRPSARKLVRHRRPRWSGQHRSAVNPALARVLQRPSASRDAGRRRRAAWKRL